MLAERGQVDMDAAFAKLRAFCRSHNRKLGVVSTMIVQRELSADEVLETAVPAQQRPAL